MNENTAVKVILEEYRKVAEELQRERLGNKVLQEEVIEKDKEIDKLKYDIDVKNERLKVMNDNVNVLASNIELLNNTNDKRIEELELKEEKVIKLQNKCKKAGDMIDELQEINKKLNKDNELLTDKSKRYEILYSNVDVDMKNLEQKNRDLKSQLIKLSINKIQTDSTLTELETVNEKVKEHIDVMCDKLNKTMTDDDKKYLEELKVKYPNYKYIARDSSGLLFIYESKPEKRQTIWLESNDIFSENIKQIQKKYFLFIKWKDKEPYEIN